MRCSKFEVTEEPFLCKEEHILTITAIDQMQQEAIRLLQSGKVIVLVPTMGYLHEGHLALMREGRKHGDALIVSIFVNPNQFGPAEDLQRYPRNLGRDVTLAESVGVDIVFSPEAEGMYDKAFQTYVDLELLSRHLCGPSRPGHFRGVATVVAKLFNIVRPQVAIFGEKDYQQLAIIRRIVRDLNFSIKIIGVPTVREPDGLAMNSRNIYLSEDERRSAPALFESLQRARKAVAGGVRDARELLRSTSELIGSYPYTRIDYVAVCDPDTLKDLKWIDRPVLMALAVWVGDTRLIDNAILKPIED